MFIKSVCRAPVLRKAISLNTPVLTSHKQIIRQAHDAAPADYKFPTLDDLPVPCGSWKEHYENNQRKYNIHLLFGTGFFLITMTFGIYSGAFDLYISPPDRPAPRLP